MADEFETYADYKEQIEDDLDLQEETFIKPEALMKLFNKAVRKANATIHTLYEDYFLTYKTLRLQAGISLVSLPDNIYANKIRSLIYDNGSTVYKLRKVKDFIDIPFINTNTDLFSYVMVNAEDRGTKIKLFPTPTATDSTSITCWYLRRAKKIENDTDLVDIPEFSSFLLEQTKYYCMQKEGHPLLEVQRAEAEEQLKLMTETLTNRTPDDENKIAMDLSHYEDMN